MAGVVCPLVLLASGCGGDDGDSGNLPAGVAAQVDKTVIRESAIQALLNATYATRDESVKTLGPPEYPGCVKAKRDLHRPNETMASIRAQCKFEYEVGRAQAVNTLVRDQWLERELARRGLNSDRVIQRATARVQKIWAKAPDKAPDVAKDPSFRSNAQWEALIAATPVTRQEVEEYGAANAEVYYQPENRRAQIAQTTTKAQALKARKALEQGKSWPEVQKDYALKATPGRWTGHLNLTEHTVPDDAFGRFVFSARRGQIVGPVHTLNGWFVFEVTVIKEPRYKKLSPQAREIVTNIVRAKKLEERPRQTLCQPNRLRLEVHNSRGSSLQRLGDRGSVRELGSRHSFQ